MHIVKGEACCCNHGYSCLVIAAAVWQKSPFFLFDMCCHHGDHEKTDRMRAISGLSVFMSLPFTPPCLTHTIFSLFVCLFFSHSNRCSLFHPSCKPLFYYILKHCVPSATHTVPSGQLSELQQVIL